MGYVAAFRTYTWDDGVAELARRFFAAFPSGRHVVFANEAKGSLGIEGYEVVSHDDDTSGIGLPDYPRGHAHWYNVDYALYILRRALPENDYYVMSESDLAVNLPLEPMIDDMRARDIDMIVHELLPSAEPWHWHANARACFDEPWRALCFFLAASGGVIDDLYKLRLRHAAEYEVGARKEWPFCETFIPSALKLLHANIGRVGEYADTENLRVRPRLALDDPRANRPGSMAHSVWPVGAFLPRLLSENDPKDWFEPRSDLSRSLRHRNLCDYGDALLDALRSRREHAAYREVMSRMEQAGRTFQREDDLAFCKPAITSSASAWSTDPDPRKDAAGANGAVWFDDFGFHTAAEERPWWMVDMLELVVVGEVAIVNRAAYADRFRQFVLESSVTGTTWTVQFIKVDYTDVSADPERPHRLVFAEPFAARYVRIRLLGHGILHLRRVQVFGRAAPP